MAGRKILPLVNVALDGHLESWLRERIDTGASTYALATELREKHGITVSAETIRTWCHDYGIPFAGATS